MTAALARNTATARLPETKAKAAPDVERVRTPVPPNTAKNAPTDDAGDGARAIASDAPQDRKALKRAARARPGAGAEKISPDAPATRQDRKVTRMADRADRLFAQLVKQRDIIRDAVEFGDKGAAATAYGRARELFAKIIAIGNEAQINMSTSTDSAALTEAKERISHRVRYAYEWAALIDEAMPGEQTL